MSNNDKEVSNNMYTQAAQIDEIFRSLKRIENSLSSISSTYVSHTDMKSMKNSIEEKIFQRIKPLEKIVYGLVGLVLSTVVLAIIALVIQQT